ncbi:membrane bound O-acyl transferase family-domain-containing protein [Schizophyllum fasciatum]
MAQRLEDPLGFTASAVLMLLPIPLVIATRPPPAVRLLVFAAQLQLANWGNKTFVLEDTFITYSLGCLYYGWPLLTAIHFYFLTDPLSDGTRHLYDKQAAKDMPMLQRFWWATCLVASFRGVGWSKPVPHLRQIPKGQSRGSFLVEHSLWLAFYILFADIVNLYITNNPITSSRAAEAFPATSQGPVFQALNSYAYWGNIWAGFNAQYEILALLGVGLGLWEPQLWPPMFGSFWDAYTVRRTWGRVWHCILRRFIISHGKWVAGVLGAAPGTAASSYAQLYTAFVVSGLMHECGDRQLDRAFGQSMSFFLLQALWITFEDGVIGLGRRLGIREGRATRALGGVATLVWFAATTPVLMRVMSDNGKPIAPSFPGSFVGAAWKAMGMEGKFEMPWPEPHY